jgi:hypothetical protein
LDTTIFAQSRGIGFASCNLRVLSIPGPPGTPQSLELSDDTILFGESSSGVVTINAPQPVEPLTVTLSSSAGIAHCPNP